jgi:parallel beta-helix repeat protein
LYYSDATLRGNTLSDNATSGDGGGLYLSNSDARISGNTITGNTSDAYGGGLVLFYSDALLSGNTITGNAAGGYGGGLVLFYSDATINSNSISGNTASRGGGLYLEGCDATVSSNTVTGNAAEGSGGGLSLSDSTATINGNTITSNRAESTEWLNGGGGLHLFYSDATLTNNIVADNQADGAGGGLYIHGLSPRLLHTTIARNRGGDGSGVRVDSGTVAMTNTILVSQAVGVYVGWGGTTRLEGTLWGTSTWANDTDWVSDHSIITGTVNVWGEPAFVDPNTGDYHIGTGSAALDQGVDAGVTWDIDHEPRFDVPDLGADEYWPPGVLKHVYLPLVFRNGP